MVSASPDPNQGHLWCAALLEQLNPAHPLLQLARQIPWHALEQDFTPLYATRGKPAKPIRLMVGLSILKHLDNLSDEALMRAWEANPYYQAFCGEVIFQWQFPCDPSDMTYFRKRIGTRGFEKILATSITVHGDKASEPEVCIDTTVQEKNTTFPTDAKLYRKVLARCVKLARQHGVRLSRTYVKEAHALKREVAYATPKNKRRAIRQATRRLRIIAGRVLREFLRKCPAETQEKERETIALYQRALQQKRRDKNKVYSLHEPHIYCVAKGKERKPYEFGIKVAITKTKDSNIILGALAFEQNQHDSKTLSRVLDQVHRLSQLTPQAALCDRGFRGVTRVGETNILLPQHHTRHTDQQAQQRQRERFRKRAGIEPIIGHLKADHRLDRNFLAGVPGDQINVLMAAAAFNFRKWLRNFIARIFGWLFRLDLSLPPGTHPRWA
jgi:IS5 family transposase